MSCSVADHHGATAPLLARSHAQSDDAEADSFEQPLVAPAVHPFTGTFAASEHTVAFGSKAFRLAFPLHVVALVFIFSISLAIVVTSVTPRLTGPEIPSLGFPLLALGARIAVHRLRCQSSAQRLGATAWTLLVAGESAVDIISSVVKPDAFLKGPFCEGATVSYLYPMLAILFGVLNASHGMEFWHTASLAGLFLCDLILVRIACADPVPVNLAIFALVVTFGAGHFAQLVARHAFLQFEHIQTSRDRLTHDFQRLEHRIFGSNGPRLPPVVTPTESSATASSAAPQRKASSAPEATGGGHTALPAGQVLFEWPPPHATHPSTAGPSTAGPSTAGPSTAGPSTAADPLSASVALSASTPSYSPLPPVSASVVTLSSVSHLDSEAVLNAPATSNPVPVTLNPAL